MSYNCARCIPSKSTDTESLPHITLCIRQWRETGAFRGLVLWCEFPVARGPGSMGGRMVNYGAGARSFSEELKSDGKRKKVRRNW